MKKTTKGFYIKTGVSVLALCGVVGGMFYYITQYNNNDTVSVYKTITDIEEGTKVQNADALFEKVSVNKSSVNGQNYVTNVSTLLNQCATTSFPIGSIVYSWMFSEIDVTTSSTTFFTDTVFKSSVSNGSMVLGSTYTAYGIKTVDGDTIYSNICYLSCQSIAGGSDSISSESGASVTFSVEKSCLNTLNSFKKFGSLTYIPGKMRLYTETETQINENIDLTIKGSSLENEPEIITPNTNYLKSGKKYENINFISDDGFDLSWINCAPDYVSVYHKTTSGLVGSYNGTYLINGTVSGTTEDDYEQKRRIDYDSVNGIYSFAKKIKNGVETEKDFNDKGFYSISFNYTIPNVETVDEETGEKVKKDVRYTTTYNFFVAGKQLDVSDYSCRLGTYKNGVFVPNKANYIPPTSSSNAGSYIYDRNLNVKVLKDKTVLEDDNTVNITPSFYDNVPSLKYKDIAKNQLIKLEEYSNINLIGSFQTYFINSADVADLPDQSKIKQTYSTNAEYNYSDLLEGDKSENPFKNLLTSYNLVDIFDEDLKHKTCYFTKDIFDKIQLTAQSVGENTTTINDSSDWKYAYLLLLLNKTFGFDMSEINSYVTETIKTKQPLHILYETFNHSTSFISYGLKEATDEIIKLDNVSERWNITKTTM